MQIFIKDLEGRTLCHSCDAQSRVQDLKEDFERIRGVPNNLVRLIVNGKQLQDDSASLEKAGVTPQCTVFTALPGVVTYDGRAMQIFVRTLAGKDTSLDVKHSDSILDVKKKYYNKEGLPPDQQHMIYAGQTLDNDEGTLFDYKIRNQSTVYVIPWLRDQKSDAQGSVLMEIFVKTCTGSVASLQVHPLDSITKVKEKFEGKEGVRPPQQDMIFNGQTLEDDRTLSYYRIFNGSTLELKLRRNGREVVYELKFVNAPEGAVVADEVSMKSSPFILSNQDTVGELASLISSRVQTVVQALKLEGSAVKEEDWVIKQAGSARCSAFWPELAVEGGRVAKDRSTRELVQQMMAKFPTVDLSFDLSASRFFVSTGCVWEVCVGPSKWEALSKKVTIKLESYRSKIEAGNELPPPVEFSRQGATYKADGVTLMQVNTATGKVRALRRREKPPAETETQARSRTAHQEHSLKRPRRGASEEGAKASPVPKIQTEDGDFINGDWLAHDPDDTASETSQNGPSATTAAATAPQNDSTELLLCGSRKAAVEGQSWANRGGMLYDFFLRKALCPPCSFSGRPRAPPEIAAWVEENLKSSVTSHRRALGDPTWCCPPRLQVQNVEICLPSGLGLQYLMETAKRKERILSGEREDGRSIDGQSDDDPSMADAKFGSLPLFSHFPASEFGFCTDVSARVQARRSATELWLWHGTSDEGVEAVCKEGFDPCRGGEATGSLYGRGTYFAENASKADLYSGPGSHRHHAYGGPMRMLLSLVFVGVRDVKLEPLDEDSQSHRPADGCDSIVAAVRAEGGRVDHREFVVFDGRLAVPLFVVTYEHAVGCACSRCINTW